MKPYTDLKARSPLDRTKLSKAIKAFFQSHQLHPKRVYLIGGFARGYGRKEHPDIDVIIDLRPTTNEELFHYLDVFAEVPEFAGYPLEFHVTSESYNPIETYPERIRLF